MGYSLIEFEELLDRASKQAVQFAQEYLSNPLPDPMRFYLIPNASFNGNPLVGDEEVFPEDTLPTKQFHVFYANEAARFLWRHGKVPEWIDISVVDIVDDETCLELMCCGRYTAESSRYYYTQSGNGPFGVKSPILPTDWDHGDPNKFSLPPYTPFC